MPGSVDITEVGDVNPHARAWIAVQPAQRADPGGARQRRHRRAGRARRAGSSPARARSSGWPGPRPDALTVKTPAAMHVVYPRGRPRLRHHAASFDEPELKTFEERQKEKKGNQEKELRRLRNLLEEAKAYGAALDAARRARRRRGPTCPWRRWPRWRAARCRW